jgi:hypothetical protein
MAQGLQYMTGFTFKGIKSWKREISHQMQSAGEQALKSFGLSESKAYPPINIPASASLVTVLGAILFGFF